MELHYLVKIGKLYASSIYSNINHIYLNELIQAHRYPHDEIELIKEYLTQNEIPFSLVKVTITMETQDAAEQTTNNKDTNAN